MNNCASVSLQNAMALEEEITRIDDPKNFIKTLDALYDSFVVSALTDGSGSGQATYEVSHYRQLRRLLERIVA